MHATVEGTPESFFTIKNERRQQYITQNETPKEVAVKNSRVEGVKEKIMLRLQEIEIWLCKIMLS